MGGESGPEAEAGQPPKIRGISLLLEQEEELYLALVQSKILGLGN